jgi:hypothetical protein
MAAPNLQPTSTGALMTSNILERLQQERVAGLPNLVGSRLALSVPVREAFLNATIERLIGRHQAVESLHVAILPANRLEVAAGVRVLGFRKTFRLDLHVQPLIDRTTGWEGALAFAERSLVSWLLTMAAPIAPTLPAGVSLNERGIVVQLAPLLSHMKAGEVMPHLDRITFETDPGVLWVSLALTVTESAPSSSVGATGLQPDSPAGDASRALSALTPGELQAAFHGAMANVHLRIAAPLANALAAAALDDAAAAGPAAQPRPNVAALIRPWVEQQLLSFENGAMVLDVVGRVPDVS